MSRRITGKVSITAERMLHCL